MLNYCSTFLLRPIRRARAPSPPRFHFFCLFNMIRDIAYLHFLLYHLVIFIVQLRANFFRISVIHSTRFVYKEGLFDNRRDHVRHHVEPHSRLYRYMFYPSEIFSAYPVPMERFFSRRLKVK